MQNYQKISTTTAIRNETIDRSTDAYNANQRVRSPLYFRLRDVDLDGWSASAVRKPTRCVIESRESWLLPLVSGCLLLFLARDHESRGKESERMEIGAIACVNSSRGLGSRFCRHDPATAPTNTAHPSGMPAKSPIALHFTQPFCLHSRSRKCTR